MSDYAEPRRGDETPALVSQWCAQVARVGRFSGGEAARAEAFDLLVDISATTPHLLDYALAAMVQVCLDADR